MVAASEHRRLRVRAEDLLEGLDYLPFTGVYASAGQQVRHQVALLVRGGSLELGQRPFDGLALAPGAHGLHAADLLALELGIDAQDLELGVAALAVAVDADHDPLTAVDLALEVVGRVGDLALRETALDRLHHAAELVDAPEVVVGQG